MGGEGHQMTCGNKKVTVRQTTSDTKKKKMSPCLEIVYHSAPVSHDMSHSVVKESVPDIPVCHGERRDKKNG